MPILHGIRGVVGASIRWTALRSIYWALIIALVCITGSGAEAQKSSAQKPFIILQSTTSTVASGLYNYILPIFTAETGIDVRVVAVGTGQALKNGRNGDGDVLLVHAKAAEEKFVADGYGVARLDVMFNDFVIVGPSLDPVRIAGSKDAVRAFSKIAAAKALFASRGDNSGTHKKELQLWASAGIDPASASPGWYRELGAGMGATLNAAVAMGAYALTDRGTWISFRNKQRHVILVEGDPRLFNQYGVILVNPARHPQVKVREGQKFIDWLVGPSGQRAIASFRLAGKQLFHPNAAGTSE